MFKKIIKSKKEKELLKLYADLYEAEMNRIIDDTFMEFDIEPTEKDRKKVKESYQKWKKDLKKNCKKTEDWKHKETWEDYPEPDYDAIHTYCKVVFEDGDKTFYYRTRNPYLKVGDKVYVPVGYKYEKKVATIIDMKDYKGTKAPYPLEKTKHIIEKVN